LAAGGGNNPVTAEIYAPPSTSVAPTSCTLSLSGSMPRYDAVGEFRSSSELGEVRLSEVRLSGVGARATLEPGGKAGQVQCRGGGNVLHMPLRQAVITRLTKLERTDTL
jgi:hypothetical protein